MKIGDRVILTQTNKSGQVIEIHNSVHNNWKPRYLVQVFGSLTTKGELVKTWVTEEDIKLDREWHRNKILEEIL